MRELTMTVVYNENLVNGNFEEEVASHVESFIGHPLHVSSQPVDAHAMSAAEAGANALLDHDVREPFHVEVQGEGVETPRFTVTLCVWDEHIGIDSLSRLFHDMMRSHQEAARVRERMRETAQVRRLDDDDDDD